MSSRGEIVPGKGELIELPSGTRLYYVDEDHSYWRCKPDGNRGKRLTGVTTAIKPIEFDPERLLRWAAKTNGIGIAELAGPVLASHDLDSIVDGLSWLEDHESIWKALEDSKLTFEDVRDRAATVGVNVHELALRALATGRPVPDLEAMTEEERGKARAVMAFWLDHDPEPLQVEQIICDPDLGVAGRFDLRAILRSKCGRDWCPCVLGGTGLIDAKTGFYEAEKHHVQLALYDHGAEVSGFGPSDWTAILQLAEDGSYELIRGVAEPADAIAALDVYRRRARIRSAAGKARKARQAVAA